MAPSAHTAWIEALVDEAVDAVLSPASYGERTRQVTRLLAGGYRPHDALEEAAFLCRLRARRKARSPQTQAEAAAAARVHLAAAELLDYISLDLRAQMP